MFHWCKTGLLEPMNHACAMGVLVYTATEPAACSDV